MPDEPITPAEPQAGATGNAPQPQAGTTTPPTPQAGSGKTFLSAEEYEQRLTQVNKEAASYRTKLKAFEDAETARQQAALSDVDKANKRAADLEAQLKQHQKQLILEKVVNAAHKKGIIDPELAALAVQDSLEFGDDGMPSNLDKALDALVKAKPFLVAKPADPATTPATPAQTAQTQQAPAVPAFAINTQGRGTINSPATGAQQGKPTRWNEVPWKS